MNYKSIFLLLFFPILFYAQETKTYSLDEAITHAQEYSYAMQDAQDDIKAAQKKVWETTTMGLPQINATADYQNYLKLPVQLIPAEFFGGNPGEFAEISFGTKHNMSASATLSQLIFDGSYIVGLQSARVYLKISELTEIKTEQAVREGIINAYAGVLMTREGIQILKKNKAVLEQNLNQTREIVKNGFGEEQDVEQLSLTLSSLENQLRNMQRLEEYNLNMLKYAMGIPVVENIILSQNLDGLLAQYHDTNLLSETFDYQNHIDYKFSENNVNANELLVKLEQSKALPSLNAFLNYGVNAYGEEFTFFKSDQKWFDSSIFGVQMNIPIFSSLMRSSRVQQAKINLEKAERAQVETSEKLNLAYQTAKLNYENAMETYLTAKESLALAERIEHKENIKFFEGISTSFELTQAQNQLYGKQQEYLQAIYELINTKAALDTALGK
jgi:outer membrane protein TolC